MSMRTLDSGLTSTVTGNLQTTIPARLARKWGIKTGMRLVWIEAGDDRVITARIHLTDLLIAACAKENGLKLVYRDKHIESIPAKVLAQIKLPPKTP